MFPPRTSALPKHLFKQIFFVVLCLFQTSQSSARSSLIKNINPKKGLILIRKGSEDGYKKGKLACFYSKKAAKVGCGKVVRVKPSSAIIKVSRKTLKRLIKKGIAKLEPPPKLPSLQLGFGLHSPLLATQGHQNVVFKDPGSTPANAVVWKESEKAATPFPAFFSIHLYQLDWQVNLEMAFFEMSYPSEVQSNFLASQDPFIATKTQSISHSLSIDYLFWKQAEGWNIGLGMGVKYSSLGISAKHSQSSVESDFAAYKETHLIYLVRVPTFWSWIFDRFVFSAGALLSLPLLEQTLSSTLSSTSPLDAISTSSLLDIKESGGFKKTGFGLDLLLNSGWNF